MVTTEWCQKRATDCLSAKETGSQWTRSLTVLLSCCTMSCHDVEDSVIYSHCLSTISLFFFYIYTVYTQQVTCLCDASHTIHFVFKNKCNIEKKNQQDSSWATDLTQSAGVFSCWYWGLGSRPAARITASDKTSRPELVA